MLAIHLVHEVSKGPASKWAPYLSQLPPHYDTLANFLPAHATELQFEHAQQIAEAVAAEVQSSWTRCTPFLISLGKILRACLFYLLRVLMLIPVSASA